MKPEESATVPQATYVSITHSAFEELSLDLMAALSAVMQCDRYSELSLKDRQAALQWFKAKYIDLP